MRFSRAFAVAPLTTLLLLGTSAAMAETTVLSSIKDNTLYENELGFLSNGAGEWFFAGKTNTQRLRRALLQFDLSSIPADATITSVTLQLHHDLGQPTSAPVSVHRTLAAWGESTSNPEGNEGAGTGSEFGDATWIHTFFKSEFWTTPGGDFEATASATTVVGPDTGFYSWSGAGLVADVSAWITGELPNHGWILVGDETVKIGSAKRFGTRENAIESQRPTLTVEWTRAALVGDLDGDGLVNAADLAILLGQWGGPGSADLDGDGSVNASDLALLLGAWSVTPG